MIMTVHDFGCNMHCWMISILGDVLKWHVGVAPIRV